MGGLLMECRLICREPSTYYCTYYVQIVYKYIYIYIYAIYNGSAGYDIILLHVWELARLLHSVKQVHFWTRIIIGRSQC